VHIRASCSSVQERIRRRFWNFRSPFCLTSLPLSVAKPEVSRWGLRGRVRERCIPSRWGPGGCAPEKFSKLQMHAGEF
jgi:hypothetical protein